MAKDVPGWAIEILGLIMPAWCILALAQSVRVRVNDNFKRFDSGRQWLSGVSVIQLGILGFTAYGTQWPHFSLLGLTLLLWFAGWIKGRGFAIAIYLSIFVGPITFQTPPSISDLKYPLVISDYAGLAQLVSIAALVVAASILFRWLGLVAGNSRRRLPVSDAFRTAIWKAGLACTLLAISWALPPVLDVGADGDIAPTAFMTAGILVGAALAVSLSALGFLDVWFQSLDDRRRDQLSVYVVSIHAAVFLGLVWLQSIAGQPALIIAHVAMAGLIVCDPALKLTPTSEKEDDEAKEVASSPENGATA